MKKSIIITILTTIFIIIAICNITDATNWNSNVQGLIEQGNTGDTISIGYSIAGDTKLTKGRYLYCVDHGGPLSGEKKYSVSNVINLSSASGLYEDKVMAYILGVENDSYGYGYGTSQSNLTTRQKAIYSYWNRWAVKHGLPTQPKNNNMGGNQLITEAENHFKASNVNANISSNVGYAEVDDNNLAGPFNVTYKADKIKTVEITDIDGNDITQFIEFFQNNVKIEPANIQSGQDFYIKNYSDKVMKSLRMEVESNGECPYSARVLVLTSSSYQKLIAVGVGRENATSQTAQTTIEIKSKVNLEVVKYGANSTIQSGVNFYLLNSEGKYAHWGSTEENSGTKVYSNITFKDWADDETRTFTTGSSGHFIVKGVSSIYTYQLQETYNPNSGYSKINIEAASLYNDYTNNMKLEYDTEKRNVVKNITLNKKDNLLSVYNIPEGEASRLTVEKLGEQEEIQPNVNFYISNSEGKYAYWNSNEEKNGERIYSNITFDIWKDNDNKMVFTTNESGKFIIENLPSSVYSIQETYNPNEGYSERVSITDAMLNNNVINDLQNTDISNTETNNIIKNVILSTTQNNILKIYNQKQGEQQQESNFNINITKVGSDGIKTIDGAEFKIKVFENSSENSFIGWLRQEENGYNYTATYDEAKTWKTESGRISIKNLEKSYSYEIYETKTANGYKLKSQTPGNGMSVIIGSSKYNNPNIGYGSFDVGNNLGKKQLVFCGRYSKAQHNGGVSLKVKNVYGNGGDDTEQDEFIEISGRIWIENSGKNGYDNKYTSGETCVNGAKVYLKRIDDETFKQESVTDSNGKYSFKNINKKYMTRYYVELRYDKIGTTYSICEYNGEQNGSKAISQGNGSASTEQVNDNNKNDLNIGLKIMPGSEEFLQKDVVAVSSRLKGSKLYTYSKDDRGIDYGQLTKVSTGDSTYKKIIYAADLAYSREINWRENSLEVYVSYRIYVKNTTQRSEKQLAINGHQYETGMNIEVSDIYDDNQYQFCDYQTCVNIDSKYKSYNGWSTPEKETSDKDGNKKVKTNLSIKPQESRELYVTFKLTKNALENVLDYGGFTGRNKTKISGKHNYKTCSITWEKEYVYHTLTHTWEFTGNYIPITKWTDHTEDVTVHPKYAPGINFELNTKGREIKGLVFEDSIDNRQNGQALGNGKYTDGENLAKGVKVDLIDKDGNSIWRYNCTGQDSNGKNIYKKTRAPVDTNEKGEYSIQGITTGVYFIRYTYGDGNQKIYNSSGSEIGEVTAYNYKSTIIKDDKIKSIIKKGKNNTDYSWYRTNNPNMYSVAVDELSDRETFNNNDNEKGDIKAITPGLDITIEIDSVNNMNFGIVTNPKIELGLELKMTNVKVTNAQGQIIIEGNPGKDKKGQNLKYLSNLDNKRYISPGSSYAKIEINNQEIYGSKLEIKYEIAIINNSDLNYYEDRGSDYGNYYLFGDINSNSKQVGIKVEQVKDYLDSLLKSSSKDIDLKNIKDWDPIYTTKYTKNVDDKTNIRKIEIDTYRNLSNKEERMNYCNQAVVTKMVTIGSDLTEKVEQYPKTNSSVSKECVENFEVPYESYFKYTMEKVGNTVETVKDNPADIVDLTIIPPTGIGKIAEYIIIAMVSGVVITIGIIFIKKKVL